MAKQPSHPPVVTREAGIRKVRELIMDVRVCMFVTNDKQGRPRSRPMQTQDAEFDGTVWFFTDVDAAMVAEIAQDPRVNIAYASPGSESYLSVSGSADVLHDQALINDMWNPLLRAWWSDPTDPRIRLVRVEAEEAEYWDTPGGKIASFISLVKGAITGNGENMESDHGKVRL